MTTRLQAKPFNITVAQVYALTSDYDYEYIEDVYKKLQDIIDKVDKKDIVDHPGRLECQSWLRRTRQLGGFHRLCNDISNETGLRLVRFGKDQNFPRSRRGQ
ncbi:hypothetical protein ACOMHN_046179 [Nucella lapillus]